MRSAGSVTSAGFYAFKGLLSNGYGVDASAGGESGAKAYVAAWMAAYSFVVPALAGVVTALAWRARHGHAGSTAARSNDRDGAD